MTTPELLKKLHKLTKDAGDADKKQIKKLRKVLRRLKDKQGKLSDALKEVETKKERHKILQEIEVLKLQRRKGVVVYKQLKQKQKAD